jgi:hypothetical protein
VTDAPFVLEVDDDELAALLARPAAPPPTDDAPAVVAPSPELLAVTNRIASQFVGVLHATASRLFSAKDPRGALQQLTSTLDALRRLAEASRDEAHLALLAEAEDEAARFAAAPHGRARDRFLARLRGWLPRYADHLGGDDGDAIRGLVHFDPDAVPLFGELREIPGVGRRRLERLFCAGLWSVEVVSAADPAEVAQVTGLPRALADDVVARARAWAEEHRRKTVVDLRARLAEFARILAAIDPAAAPDLHALAAATIDEMRGMVAAHAAGGEH